MTGRRPRKYGRSRGGGSERSAQTSVRPRSDRAELPGRRRLHGGEANFDARLVEPKARDGEQEKSKSQRAPQDAILGERARERQKARAALGDRPIFGDAVDRLQT